MVNDIWKKKNSAEYLSNDQIHIWLLDIQYLVKRCSYDDLLFPEEIDKMNKFHFLKDQFTYSYTRGVLRKLISEYTGVENSDIVFEYNKYGKPYLNNSNFDIQFNVSHSKQYALIGFTLKDQIGVDIEYLNKELIIQDIVDKYFSQNEVTALFKKNSADQQKAFFNIWSRKEAYIKARGMGLSIPLDSFDVSVDETSPQILRADDALTPKNKNLTNLVIHPDYCGAVVNIGKEKKIKHFYYDPE